MAVSTESKLNVESRGLLKRAAWCGVVFALAMLITVLNLLPPVSVHYRVKSQVVVSESRLEQLNQRVSADREALHSGEPKSIQLVQVDVLDYARHHAGVGSEGQNDKVVLVELLSDWSERCSEEKHLQWLEENTQSVNRLAADDSMAERVRLARWELETARHYLARHAFLSSPSTAPEPIVDTRPETAFDMVGYPQSDGGTDQVTSGIPTTTAAYLASASPPTADSVAIENQLYEKIQQAEQQAQQAELAWQQRAEKSAGLLQVAGLPVITPKSTPIPFWMASSILVLGLAAGATAGWFQHRLQSGGAHEPTFVAEQLALESLPLAVKVELPAEQIDKVDWVEVASRQAGQAGRRTARRLTQISEGALAFWVLLILIRFCTDTVWLKVMLDSPLAALGRLMSGMP